ADVVGRLRERVGREPRPREDQPAEMLSSRVDRVERDRGACADDADRAGDEPVGGDERDPTIDAEPGRILVPATHAEELRRRLHELGRETEALPGERGQPDAELRARDVRDEQPLEPLGQRAVERVERTRRRFDVQRVAAGAELAADDLRPLDPRVADVDDEAGHGARTLTSPASTRLRAPPAVSTSSAPSASMPSAVAAISPAG